MARDDIDKIVLNRFIAAVADGIYYVLIGILLLLVRNFEPTTVGFMLSTSGVAALFAGIAGGYLLTYVNFRFALFALAMTAASAVVLYANSDKILVATLFIAIARSAQKAAITMQLGALPHLVAETDRLIARARVQKSFNIGLATGSLFGGIVGGTADHSYVQYGFIAMAVIYFLSGLFMLFTYKSKVVGDESAQRISTSSLGALSDLRFLSFTLLFAGLLFNVPLVDLVLPVWISSFTPAPLWTISMVLVVNTLVVILLQTTIVEISRRYDQTKMILLSSYIIGVSFLLYMTTAFVPSSAVAIALVFIAAAVQAAGEVLQFSAGWSLSYKLTKNNGHGQYQGVFSAALPVAEIFAPLLFSVAIMHNGASGWLLFGTMFLCIGHAINYLYGRK